MDEFTYNSTKNKYECKKCHSYISKNNIKRHLKTTKHQNYEPPIQCIICFEDISDDKFKTECNHIFHKTCLDTWLQRQEKCPLCRREVVMMCILNACKFGRMDLVKSYIESGVSVNYQDYYHDTPLIIASDYGQYEIVRYLIANGADLEIKDDDGSTALSAACETEDSNKTIQYLVQKGANVNIQDHDGCTPIMYCAEYHNIESAVYLIEHGADVNIQNNEGTTLFMLAAMYNNLNLVTYLCEKTNVECWMRNDNCENALAVACKYMHLDIIHYLYKNLLE